jgi:hypothetical protein
MPLPARRGRPLQGLVETNRDSLTAIGICQKVLVLEFAIDGPSGDLDTVVDGEGDGADRGRELPKRISAGATLA